MNHQDAVILRDRQGITVTFWGVTIYYGVGLAVIFTVFSGIGLLGHFHLLELKMSAAMIMYAAGLTVWLVRAEHYDAWQALARVAGAVVLDTSIFAAMILAVLCVRERLGDGTR